MRKHRQSHGSSCKAADLPYHISHTTCWGSSPSTTAAVTENVPLNVPATLWRRISTGTLRPIWIFTMQAFKSKLSQNQSCNFSKIPKTRLSILAGRVCSRKDRIQVTDSHKHHQRLPQGFSPVYCLDRAPLLSLYLLFGSGRVMFEILSTVYA